MNGLLLFTIIWGGFWLFIGLWSLSNSVRMWVSDRKFKKYREGDEL
jgi:uncharacterized protein HemY